jgi:hypothetical protein
MLRALAGSHGRRGRNDLTLISGACESAKRIIEEDSEGGSELQPLQSLLHEGRGTRRAIQGLPQKDGCRVEALGDSLLPGKVGGATARDRKPRRKVNCPKGF